MLTSASHSGIEWSDEHALLLSSATELLARRSDFAAVRTLIGSELGFDSELLREIAQLGWFGLCVPAEYGGAGLTASALPCLFEPMGRQLVAGPYLATTLAAQLVMHAASEAQKQALLPAMARGEALATVALYEPEGSYDLGQLQVTAEQTAEGYRLSGVKTSVLDALAVEHVVIAANIGGEPALLVAPALALKERLTREQLIDETRRSYRLHCDGLVLGRDALLEGGGAVLALQRTERMAWLLLAAEMSGGCEGVFQLTLEYLRTRTQFGKPIGSYQALKHPMVETMCALEEGRSLLYHAATALGGAAGDAEIAARMAKAQLGETYTNAADRSIQFHGALGFTYDCQAQLFFRRAQWAEHSFGDALHHRGRLGDLL